MNRFWRNLKFSFKIKKDDEKSKEVRSKMVGEVIARGGYISKHGKISEGFKLGEPKKNEKGHYRYEIKQQEEKMCKYCAFNTIIESEYKEYATDNSVVIGGYIRLGAHEEKIKINFCPFCGKDLADNR